MEFSITKENLIQPLSLIMGVVDKKQTSQILSFVLLKVLDNKIILTATDSDIEIKVNIKIITSSDIDGFTFPGKKLLDICKTLPDNSEIKFLLEKDKLKVLSGKSKFSLSSIDKNEFPVITEKLKGSSFPISKNILKQLLQITQFSMAQTDIRHYFLGMLWELKKGTLRVITTDGHRLSIAESNNLDINLAELKKIIIPKKSILELIKLLPDDMEKVWVTLTDSYMLIKDDSFSFTTKLLDATFPNYESVILKNPENIITIDKEVLKQTLLRVSILTNEKSRAVRFVISNNVLSITSNNPEQEHAEEELEINYQGKNIEIGFNVNYLLDILGTLPEGDVEIKMKDANSSVLLNSKNNFPGLYIVMPLHI
tara:strand:+ start:1503 stop:2609 length:1107 start_codon:yes stop_codon:yes gene_type:complete